MSIRLDRYMFSFTEGQHPGEMVKIPHETQSFYEADIQLETIDISNAVTIDLNFEGSTIRILTSDNTSSPHSIEAIILYEDSMGVFSRAHSLNQSSVVTFTETGSTGFKGGVSGFFIHELCEEDEIGDIDFTIIFESESSRDTLMLNVLENMTSGTSSYSQTFSERTSDNLFFDYTLTLRNSPYYGNITPLAIVSLIDDENHESVNAYTAATANHVRDRKILKKIDIAVYGLEKGVKIK